MFNISELIDSTLSRNTKPTELKYGSREYYNAITTGIDNVLFSKKAFENDNLVLNVSKKFEDARAPKLAFLDNIGPSKVCSEQFFTESAVVFDVDTAGPTSESLGSSLVKGILEGLGVTAGVTEDNLTKNDVAQKFVNSPFSQKMLSSAIEVTLNPNFVLSHLVDSSTGEELNPNRTNFGPIVNFLADHMNKRLNNESTEDPKSELKGRKYINVHNGLIKNHDTGKIDPRLYVQEGYDGQYLHNMVRTTLALAVGIIPDDPVTAALFPAIPIDYKVKGMEFVSHALFFTEDSLHDPSGKPKESPTTPMMKSLFDEKRWLVNYLSIDPIVKGGNVQTGNSPTAEYLLQDFAYLSDVGGHTHVSAPVVVGARDGVGFLGLCSSAGNQLDTTDTLERAPRIVKVIISAGKGDTKEFFEINTSASALGNGTLQVANGDMNRQDICFEDDSYSIRFGKNGSKRLASISEADAPRDVKNKETYYKDSKLATLIGVSEDNEYAVNLILDLKISLEMDTSKIRGSTDDNAVRVNKILRNGKLLPSSDPDYIAIAKFLDKDKETIFRWAGFVLDAQVTNSNRRMTGSLMTFKTTRSHITVPFQSGHTVRGPLQSMDYRGDNNDINNLPELTMLINQSIYHEQYFTLRNYIESLKHISQTPNYTAEKSQLGIATTLLNPYYKELTLDVFNLVDSRNSADRINDVRAALFHKIRLEGITMLQQSNYYGAMKLLKAGQKACLVIATDLHTGAILANNELKVAGDDSGFYSLTPDLDLKIVTTPHEYLRDKILGVFCRFTQDRNTTIDPLQFGCTFVSPPIVYTGNDQVGTTVHRYTNTIGRFQTAIHTPVMFVMNIHNLQETFGKIEQYVNVNPPKFDTLNLDEDGEPLKNTGAYGHMRGVNIDAAYGIAGQHVITHIDSSMINPEMTQHTAKQSISTLQVSTQRHLMSTESQLQGLVTPNRMGGQGNNGSGLNNEG